MKRQKSQSVMDRNQALLEQIKALKTDHPLWGYRRVWAHLKYRQGIPVNKKRVYRLMKEQNFLVTKNYKLKAKRHSTRPELRAERPNHFWALT